MVVGLRQSHQEVFHYMFVINFDFSSYSFLHKLAAVNIPVALTELVTYPFQRLQTNIIRKEVFTTPNQFTEMPLVLAQMFKVEGFPKCFHGFRYSLDYSFTLMTFKFFVFDILMGTSWADSNKYAVYLSCIAANAMGTMASQSAFNYQTIASSLEPSSTNTTESVKNRLIKFTERKNVFRNGLKYTLPVSIINSILEVITIIKLEGKFLKTDNKPLNDLVVADTGEGREEFIIAAIVLGLTNTTNHFAVQRQVELCFNMQSRIRYWKGFTASLVRNMSKGMILYYCYYKYFEWMMTRSLDEMSSQHKGATVLPAYYQKRTL